MNNLRPIFVVLLVALLAACNPQNNVASEEPPLAGASIGGPFSLTDQDGKPVSDTDFTGRYRIIYFGYSYCPDVCPVDLQRLMQGLKRAEKADPAIAQKLVPIFITIDPERDTPAQLKQYVAAFHPRLIGLTGTPEQIAKVAKAYVVIYNRRESPGASEYLMDHSSQAYLFGPNGEPVALLPNDPTASPQQVADVIMKWVK